MNPSDTSPKDIPPSDNDLDFAPTLRGLRAGLKVFDARYTLVRQLGRGGMGVVWLARDEKLELEVALKFLPDNLKDDLVAVDELRRETKRCLELTHPNIVRIFDLAEDEQMVAIAMEYVEGGTLAALRLEKPTRCFEAAEMVPWIKQVCEALSYAHERARVVHRDLKPSNIMISGDSGRVKLADFGIASSLSDTMSRMTRSGAGAGAGTLVYMSPQQLMGYPPSVSDDVYALGATIYELLTGKPPFFRGSIERQIESVVPPSMAERRAELEIGGTEPVPALWEEVIATCLEKEADKRPQSVAEVWQRLSVSSGYESPMAGVEEVNISVQAHDEAELGSMNFIKKDRVAVAGIKGQNQPNRILLLVVALLVVAVALVWWFGESATMKKETPLVNSLGMKFVAVPGTQVMICVHETRNMDYAAYAAAQNGVDEDWKEEAGSGKDHHPVINVSYDDAEGFCRWLSAKEGKTYRLPTDAEWSTAVGLTNEKGQTPAEKYDYGVEDVFPWGNYYPPKPFDGNYCKELLDEGTLPVMSLSANEFGIYDLGGNVWEWCRDWYDDSQEIRVLRGASWHDGDRVTLRSSFRIFDHPSGRLRNYGFRCALVVSGS